MLLTGEDCGLVFKYGDTLSGVPVAYDRVNVVEERMYDEAIAAMQDRLNVRERHIADLEARMEFMRAENDYLLSTKAADQVEVR